MKKVILLGLVSLFAAPRFARAAADQCVPEETAVIDSEAHCVDNGGIDIGESDSEGIKVACLESKRVQNTCGPDGRLTRLHAYTLWFNKLQAFQAHCMNEGGTFSYDDNAFVEPHDESFCLQAQPEISSNMFEEPLCNYRSLCPAIKVVCSVDCGAHSRTASYDGNPTSNVPTTASLLVQ